MKNVITILVDSVFSECLGKQKTQISSTPFIDTLIEKGIFVPNIYSYGPYTDAATKGLFCGQPTLKDYGYYFGVNSSDYNHFTVFSENGFEIFGLYYPYYLIGQKIESCIDHSIYTGGFKYESVWGGKFKYYAELKITRQLKDVEYKLMFKCLEMVFDCWMQFYDNLQNQRGSDFIVKNIKNSELEGSGKTGLYREISNYYDNPKAYIDDILKLGMSHPLALINEYDYGRHIDAEFVRDVYKKNSSFFKKLNRVNILKNLKNNPIQASKIIKNLISYIKTHDKDDLRYIGNYLMLLLYPQMMKTRSQKFEWQDIASLNVQIDALLSGLENRNMIMPFYASLHALEPHHNISFFSFDSFDHTLIEEELAYISPLIDMCGDHFSGNLVYQLSLRYVDLCVQRLVERLKASGLLENTIIMLVADHGTSYYFNPVRTRVVNTFHKENYKIPMLIWGEKLTDENSYINEGLFMSDDIFPTLFNLVGIKKPKQFTGTPIQKNTMGREYVITEYMGPGVPDMLSKEIWISIRDSKYVIAYQAPIGMELDEKAPKVVYDLQTDPLELINQMDTNPAVINCYGIQKLIKILKNRFNEIKEDTTFYINNLLE